MNDFDSSSYALPEEAEVLRGFVDHVIYRNEDNGYSVFVFQPDDDEGAGSDITCVGNFASLAAGENLELTGLYVENPTYGTQFKVVSQRFIRPERTAEIERYLAGGAIKGIGPTLAKKIVKKFKKDTFRVMEDEPERLAEISGISLKMAQSFGEQMVEKRDIRDVSVFLQGFGITPNMALRIYEHFGTDIYTIIKENPYRLADEIDGIGFRTADRIAGMAGLPPDSEDRVASCILYLLGNAAGEGHTYLPEHILKRNLLYLINVSEETFDAVLSNMEVERRVKIIDPHRTPTGRTAASGGPGALESRGETAEVRALWAELSGDSREIESDTGDDRRIYLPVYYHMEKRTADRLLSMRGEDGADTGGTSEKVRAIEEREGITLGPAQRKAVMEAAASRFFILTGGPGTGKTTTLRVLITYFEEEGLDVALAAPTGRAAKRMSEATGRPARTIHRLLEVEGRPSDEGRAVTAFGRNEDNPLEYDAVIIDETSMVDLSLFYSLLKAVPEECALILVGDRDQLPSVGPGNVLRDLLDSGLFPSVYLDTIFRQAAESDIVKNAHYINEGKPVTLDNKSRDFFFMERPEADSVINTLISLYSGKLEKYAGCEWSDIQVMCPSKKGLTGVSNINEILQEKLNPPEADKPEKKYGDRVFRVGDKVMQMKNDYHLPWRVFGKGRVVIDSGEGVFNGDIGTIEGIYPEASIMRVAFDDGREADYPFSNLENIDLAYAITIHKSQGSEYPVVVIPLLPGPRQLMNRNLLYTAVTRARKCVILIGRRTVFSDMENNSTAAVRYSGLRDFLLDGCRLQ